MDNTLATVLVEKKLLKEEMEVTARYLGADLSGTNKVNVTGEFFIQRVQPVEKDGVSRMVFVLRSTKDGSLRKVYSEAIEKVEGMPPDRFASVYNIKADGSSAATKKKRGRKPKAKLVQQP